MKNIKRIAFVLLGLLVFSIACTYLFFYFNYGPRLVADSEQAPPYELWHRSYPDAETLKKEIVRFGYYKMIGRKAVVLHARRVMPKNMFSGINGWDYLAYQPAPSSFDAEVKKWKAISDKDESWPVDFVRPPAWWPAASKLELVAHIYDFRHEHIQFQQIFITKDGGRIFIYNNWGD
jgi:hypothetical protein